MINIILYYPPPVHNYLASWLKQQDIISKESCFHTEQVSECSELHIAETQAP